MSIQPRTSSRTARYGEIAAVTATTPLRASRLATNPMRRMLCRGLPSRTETLREVLAHLVAVEQLDPMAARRSSSTTMFGDRALAGTRKAGEPEAEAGRAHGRGRLREGRREGEIMEVLSHDRSRRDSRPVDSRHRDHPREACGVFGVYAPGQRGRARHLPRPLRAAAPRAGVGGHRGERRRDDHRRQGHGPRHAGVRRAPARAARRPPRRSGTSATRRPVRAPGATRSRCTGRSPTPASRSATTATSRTPRSSPASSACCRACSPPTAS